MNFFLRAPLLFHRIIMLLCFSYMIIHHVDSQTTGSSNLSCIETERFALLNIKSSLVLASPFDLLDWTRENMDCCRWQGIHCSEAGRVVKIDLSNYYLQGVIPQTFSNLTSLKTLFLSWNRLNNSYAFLQSGSNSLQELHVNGNILQGSLPNFSKFPNLQVLNLAKNEFIGGLPTLLQRSSNLIKLDVSSNRLYGTLTESCFQNLSNLQVLSLSSNSLTLNFSTRFAPPFQLRILKLGGCKLGKIFPHWLRTQKNLTSLVISGSGISDNIPSWFWNISSRLKYLNVSHNSILGRLPPNSLSSCEYIDLSFNRFYGTLPSFSDRLRFLDVSCNAFSGGITFLCGLQGMDLISRNLSSLVYLNLSNNSLSGILPNCWKNLKGLEYLFLNKNKFIGTLPNSIGLSSLKSLLLRNNNFSGNLPQSLKNCRELNVLDLGNNKFSGRLPDWIGTSVTDLVILRLNSNNFEGNVTSGLCRPKQFVNSPN